MTFVRETIQSAAPPITHEQELHWLQLSYQLQSSLDHQKILETFSEALNNADVPHDALRYTSPENNIHYILGQDNETHTLSYHLKYEGESLGVLTLLRAAPFNGEEIEKTELLLGALVLPLNNSHLYSQAVAAAVFDPLTGVHNRTSLESDISIALANARRHKLPLAALLIDLDHFKTINDTYGHLAGDYALMTVAQQLQTLLRTGDVVYRYGGDEFFALLRNTTPEGAQVLAERLRQSIDNTILHYEDTPMSLTLSIGLATSNGIDDSPAALLDRTDRALYQAKHGGRNQVGADLSCL